jgi:hypothetical protein
MQSAIRGVRKIERETAMKLRIADPLPVSHLDECVWYHTFDFPDGTHVRGRWDYRPNVDDYIGRLDYNGKRVVEIGPASGFLTRAMEQRGAAVVCIDTSPNVAWNTVPRLDRNAEAYTEARKSLLPRLWKSWWLSRKVFGGNAKIAYTGADALRDVEEQDYNFDIALVGSVLQHFSNPYVILSHLARLCHIIVVTEQYIPRLDIPNRHLCEFIPRAESNDLGSWWLLSPSVVEQMMKTLNFRKESEYLSVFTRWDLRPMTDGPDTFRKSRFYTHIYRRTARDDSRYMNLLET